MVTGSGPVRSRDFGSSGTGTVDMSVDGYQASIQRDNTTGKAPSCSPMGDHKGAQSNLKPTIERIQ